MLESYYIFKTPQRHGPPQRYSTLKPPQRYLLTVYRLFPANSGNCIRKVLT